MNININKKTPKVIIITSLILVASMSITIYGVSKKQQQNNKNNKRHNVEEVEKDKNKNKVLEFSSEFDYDYNLADNDQLADNSNYIAIIKVDSIDGFDIRNRKTREYMAHPYTYGNATILNVLKGNIENKNIKYVRIGGEVPYKDWLDGDVDREKIERIRKEAGLANESIDNITVKYKAVDDIEIEKGKVYLAYLVQNSSNYADEYIIHALQYGLREVQQSNTTNYTDQNMKNIKVKNNMTGKWENLSDIVPIDIDK